MDNINHTWTALHIACNEGFTATALHLLESKADPHVGTHNSFTALHFAADKCINLVDGLLEKRANPQAKTAAGYSPIHLCAQYNKDPAVLRLLCDRGASIDSRSKMKGKLPIHYAAQRADVDMLQCLISMGAAVDVQDRSGNNALYFAAAHGRAENCRILVSHGCTVKAWDAARASLHGTEIRDVGVAAMLCHATGWFNLGRFKLFRERCRDTVLTLLTIRAGAPLEIWLKILSYLRMNEFQIGTSHSSVSDLYDFD